MSAKEIVTETVALFACASVLAKEDRLTVLREALDGGVDLDKLEQMALKNDVGPLLYRDAIALNHESSTAGNLALRLKGNHDFNMRRSAALLFELSRLLRLMNDAGISIIPYKGPSFGLRYYDSPGHRPCGDLDFMVAEADVDRAVRLLQENRYRLRSDEWGATERIAENGDNEVTLDHQENPLFTAELHWGLLSPGLGQMGAGSVFWRESRETDLKGIPTRAFTPEAELVVMALHGGLKHEWIPLRVLGDLARLVDRNPELDWDTVLNLARAPSARRWLLLGLDAAAQFLGAEVPASLLASQGQTHWHRTMLAVIRARYGCPGLAWPSFGQWRRAFHRQGSPSNLPLRLIQDVLLYAMGALTPQYPDHLPKAGKPVMTTLTRYVGRPWRQFRKHGLKLVRRAAGSEEGPNG